MALVELWPRRIVRSVQSTRGFRQFQCTWEERKLVEPRRGDPWPEEDEEEGLFVEEVTEEQIGRPEEENPDTPETVMCKLLVLYSTRTPYLPIRSTDLGIEMLETTAFRTWYDAGTLSTLHASMPYPLSECTYDTVTWIDPRGIIEELRGCVNGLPWEGFGRGCILYLGARVRDEYTNLGEHAWRAQHKFMVRNRDWNIQWREAKQARNSFGDLQWDAETGEPVMVEGVAGESDWDRLVPELFPYANFNPLYLVR